MEDCQYLIEHLGVTVVLNRKTLWCVEYLLCRFQLRNGSKTVSSSDFSFEYGKRQYIYDVHENCLIFKTIHSPWPSTSKIHPPWPWTSNFKRNPPPTPCPLQQTMEQQPHRACKRTKSKQKQNQVSSHSNCPHVLLFDLAHKQCSGVIKGWFHCLTSESIGRLLVNNILIFHTAWRLVRTRI